jgi:hypothetical protein
MSKTFEVDPIHFQINIAQNTGKPFEVGYVFCDGRRQLFCKYSVFGGFKLCNEFEELGGK